MRKIVLLERLCLSLSLSLLFFLEIHFIVASCTMLLFLILQVDARVWVFSAAGMATRCPATGVDENSYGTATAQLRHSYGTASSSRMTSVYIRNATTNWLIPLLCTRQTNLSWVARPNCTIICSSQDRRLDLGNCKKSCHIFPLAEVSHFCTTRFDDQAVLYVSHGCPKVIPCRIPHFQTNPTRALELQSCQWPQSSSFAGPSNGPYVELVSKSMHHQLESD